MTALVTVLSPQLESHSVEAMHAATHSASLFTSGPIFIRLLDMHHAAAASRRLASSSDLASGCVMERRSGGPACPCKMLRITGTSCAPRVADSTVENGQLRPEVDDGQPAASGRDRDAWPTVSAAAVVAAPR